MNEILRQRRETLEEFGNITTTLARLQKLLREQDTNEPAAFEESARCIKSFDFGTPARLQASRECGCHPIATRGTNQVR